MIDREIDMSLHSRVQAITERVEKQSQFQLQREVAALWNSGIRNFDDLLAALLDEKRDPEMRKVICWLLGRLAEESAMPALTSVLANAPSDIRAEAARALGTLGFSQVTAPLISAMHQDEDSNVRMAAAYGLGLFRNMSAVSPLIRALENRLESTKVRGMAAESLVGQSDPRAAVPLIAALSDPSPEVRFWAAFAVGELGFTEATSKLEELAASDTSIPDGLWPVKDEASSALARIGDDRPPLSA